MNVTPAPTHPAPAPEPDPRELGALEQGRAFVALSGWGMVRVSGADARAWLHDLFTADIASLGPGTATRALFLTPTGRIRADVHVQSASNGFLMLQDPLQPDSIGDLLGPYVLSSDVVLDDVAAATVGFAIPGRGPASLPSSGVFEPSVFGEGRDLIADHTREPALRNGLTAAGLVEAGADALEVWRIRRGRPRMGVDYGTDRHPAEIGLDEAIDAEKGCFPGQEAVAKLRNLGHPPWLFLAVHADHAPTPGDDVLAGTDPAGVVTSVAPAAGGGWTALIRVRWASRDAALRIGSANPVRRAHPAS